MRNPFSRKCPCEFGRGMEKDGKGGIERTQTPPGASSSAGKERAREVFVCVFFPALYQLETSVLVNPHQPVSNALIFSHSPAGQKLTLKLLPPPPPASEPFREGKEEEMKPRNHGFRGSLEISPVVLTSPSSEYIIGANNLLLSLHRGGGL